MNPMLFSKMLQAQKTLCSTEATCEGLAGMLSPFQAHGQELLGAGRMRPLRPLTFS